MSGIENMKLKAKLSIDEMHETKSVGKPESQQDGHPAIQPSSHLTNHLANQQSIPQILMDPHVTETKAVRRNEKSASLAPKDLDNQQNGQTGNFSKKQQSTTYTPQNSQNSPDLRYKMTFTLSEKMHKAFNHLHAKRTLNGCPIEKSNLMCEIIEYFVTMHEELN